MSTGNNIFLKIKNYCDVTSQQTKIPFRKYNTNDSEIQPLQDYVFPHC